MQAYKPDSVFCKSKTLIIYLVPELPAESIFLPFGNGRANLECRYT